MRGGKSISGLAEGAVAWWRVGARTIGLVVGESRGAAAVYTTLVLISALNPVAQVWLAKQVIDALTQRVGVGAREALWLACGYALTLIAPAALEPPLRALAAWLDDRAVAEVDRSLMAAGERLVDLERLERPAFHDDVRTAQDATWLLPRLFNVLETGPGATVSFVGILALLAGLHPVLPLALLVATVPHMWAEKRARWIAYEAMSGRSRAAREMDYCARMTTELEAAKEVRVFGLGGFFLSHYDDRLASALSEVTRVRLGYLRMSGAFGVFHSLVVAGGFWYVASRAAAGGLSLGDLALYLNAIAQSQVLSQFLRRGYSLLYETLLYSRGLFQLLDAAGPEIRIAPAHESVSPPARLRQGIELRGVAFSYPEAGSPVLMDVNLWLRAGQITALVGHNGAGKSTLVKLLSRMYDPDEGEILLDGRPLWEYDLTSLRSGIAVVYQDFAHFSHTLGENIAAGFAPTGSDDGKIAEAARLSGADVVAAGLHWPTIPS